MTGKKVLLFFSGVAVGVGLTFVFRHSSIKTASTNEMQTQIKSAITENTIETFNSKKNSIENQVLDIKNASQNQTDLSGSRIADGGITVGTCVERLKPSDIQKWQISWNDRTNKFLISDDFIWRTGTDRSIDPRILESALGIYTGNFRFGFDPKVESNVIIKLSQDSKSSIVFKAKFPVDNGYSTSECSETFNSKTDLGTDGNNNSVNIILGTCLKSRWSSFINFGIKIPAGLPLGQSTKIDVSALAESMEWKAVGTSDLKRQSLASEQ